MSYNELIQQEGLNQQFLIVVKPSRQVTSWTFAGTNIYKNLFDYGYVCGVSIDGVDQTLSSSPSLSSGQYYWDNDNQEVYVYSSSPSSEFISVTYELHFATMGAHFNRIPTDSSTTVVYFDPIVSKPPQIKATLTDSLFGFLPSQSTTVVLGNDEHWAEKHLYDSSFNQKQVLVYHWLGDLETANIKLVMDMLSQNVSYSGDNITIRLLDKIDQFDKEYRGIFYSTSTFSGLDPNHEGRPIRFVYGVVDELYAVNIDYVEDNPTTSDNRDWAVREGSTNAVNGTVPASPVSTTTRTYLNSVNGFNVGDNVKFSKASTEYGYVTAVGANYIDHAALSVACTNGDTVTRPTVSQVWINQDGARYRALYDRDYSESVVSGVLKISFNTNTETNLGINTLASVDQVSCRVYGKTNDVTLGGSPFGSTSTTYNALTDPAVILFELIKDAGVSEDNIDTASFTTLQGEIGGQDIGFAIPKQAFSNFPKFKELISDILATNLVKLFINNDIEWEAARIKPIGTEDFDIADDEILEKTINYRIEYKDILSQVIVAYRYKEALESSDKESVESDTAKYLHGVSKQKTFNTILLEQSDASTLATRLSDIYGDRQGEFRLQCKNRFFNAAINDIINVELEKLLGFEYVEGTVRNRDYNVLEIDKGLRSTNMTLNDQKGIEDNSGDF